MRRALVFLIALLFACGQAEEPASEAPAPRSAAQPSDPSTAKPSDPRKQDVVRKIVTSEEVLLEITPALSRLEASAQNLRLPDHRSRTLFAEEVAFADVAASSEVDASLSRDVATRRHWEVRDEETAGRDALDLWRSFLDGVAWFEHSAFQFVDGTVRKNVFEAKLSFSGLVKTTEGSWRSVSASIDTRWRNLKGPRAPRRQWRIERFLVERFETIDAPMRLFSAAAADALPPRTRVSLHEEHLLSLAREPETWKKPHRYFRMMPTDWQPGLSVVDLDRDGYDDLYVMDRWGKAMLLHNRGDGTFEDVAGKVGLDVQDHNCCAIFADFDNDGDADVFLGRTLERTLYLENEDGRFVDRSDRVAVPLPALVTSISAADYDGDGLLDVYISTYAAELIDELDDRVREGTDPPGPPLREFLTPRESRQLARRRRTEHRFLGRAGPPNLLLVNRGGRFESAPESGDVAIWRNTFQATWSDYDGDGDPDLYVANDFSPNNLMRNDGGKFVDVTEPSGTADIGFGMGASWGDYDNDGRHDLYVSNMYSKAGRRITAQVPGLDPRIAAMSRGNSLFRNRAGPDPVAQAAFEKVSGLEKTALQVEKAGWSWGGQFADVDNDGFLDVYASSGMYTAPGAVRIRGADL